jgi:hypothetical protein
MKLLGLSEAVLINFPNSGSDLEVEDLTTSKNNVLDLSSIHRSEDSWISFQYWLQSFYAEF